MDLQACKGAKNGWLARKMPLLETIICCLSLLVLAVYSRTLWLPFWIGFTAPLFLLQSDKSTAVAARLFSSVSRRCYIPFEEKLWGGQWRSWHLHRPYELN
jgi:hypothetical protein